MALKALPFVIIVVLLAAGILVFRANLYDPVLNTGQKSTHYHPGCMKLEAMLKLGMQVDRKTVLEILGHPNRLGDGGSKRSRPYSTAEMLKAQYWGYG